ncbi:MAG: hypothetical protein M3Z14_02650 [Candidatus Eremiobacteraeota bacterium]|nr:hypothetical protein [Candidatus Eremiobacteraeota bacterium]
MIRPPLALGLLVAFWLLPCAAPAEPAPRPDASPVHVLIRLHIDNLVNVDELRETWQVSGDLVERWKAPKLAYARHGRLDSHRDLAPASTWQPTLGFINEAAPATLTDLDLYETPDGSVVRVQHFTVTLATQLDLRRFPFDKQELPIVMEPRGHDADRILLFADTKRSSVAAARYVGLSQWRNPVLSARRGIRQSDDFDVNALIFTLTLQRGSNSYVWKFILPLFLIVLISWVSFWLSHEEFKTKDQLGTLVSTLLIIVAFNITATASLPRTNYVTYIDAFLLACFMFVILAIAAVVGTHFLQMRQQEDAAYRMRRMAGTLLPVTFVIAQIGMLAWFFRI